ncbi:glycosyltransferase family 4 protein [Planomonospora venezuelensis]|uniref:Glycosyltransferase involved in cell wall biosynthesis n=1 Tax=Planomonospora venezuelensis TaxID=1999 RepID=A0A841D5S9_PLAVE|nr:glycosyltransferase family 4 protein [Planomonospora venezuelensis]MBB5963495.1 glycosyltransferase involved in cell wall biosynthesis [Planomonospora venezuelensis]GIN05583.1 glycosyl transferase [Planomonospora venezuelensis]
MRVAFVLGTSAGGVGRHVAMLAGGLLRRGHRVVVAGPQSTEEAFGFGGLGARFVPVPISDRPRPAADLRAVRALRALRGADAVHAHGLRAGALAALALAGTGTGPVVTLHNAATAGGAVGAVHAVLERVVARLAGRILVVSPDLGDRMAALGARHVEGAVVPAPELAPPGRSPEEIRAELGAGDRPVLLTVARLAQQKGLETLLDVAAALASGSGRSGGTGPEARALFLVAGEGPLREELQRRIDAEDLQVRLLGNRSDVGDLLAVARALVVPSRWEGQPLSVQEALRAGTPVVATAVGGIPPMVGGGGVLVPYGDAAAMAGAVGRIVADDGFAGELAREAARRGGELPGEPEALEAVLSVYAGLGRAR